MPTLIPAATYGVGVGRATHGGCPLGAPSSAGGLPGIGCGLPLEVLMVREDDTGSLGHAAGFSGSVANGSMVPG